MVNNKEEKLLQTIMKLSSDQEENNESGLSSIRPNYNNHE